MAYSKSSPYAQTSVYKNNFLDVMVNRPIPMDPTDQLFTINQTYNLRPDLLAFDLYNDSRLWWVFAQRNPNRLKDPLFDFVTGVNIYIPKLAALKQSLGI